MSAGTFDFLVEKYYLVKICGTFGGKKALMYYSAVMINFQANTFYVFVKLTELKRDPSKDSFQIRKKKNMSLEEFRNTSLFCL